MQPSGLREVERARADGRWDAAYEPQSAAQVPEDLARELDRDPAARAFFESLDSRNRYAILYRIQDAKRPRPAPGESRRSWRCSRAANASTTERPDEWSISP